ncbi:MAG: carboxypeptidase regulatory-like domain-containing protein [Acidobacteria bacterium]|nr:carboxypeptidase regulatory-like domain-containing protein [Acidobacteriota bacterium]
MKRLRTWMLVTGLVLGVAWPSEGAGAETETTSLTTSAGYRIAGIALDAVSGQPLARTEVSIESQEDKKMHEAYTTGTDGRFSFDGLPAGRYVLMAGRRGYVKQVYKFHEGYSTAIVVGPGLKTDEVRFAMTLGSSFTGQVLDERGDAVRNARVMLLREVSTGRRRRLTRAGCKYTNDLGMYRFGHLSAGVYVVAATARVWYADATSTGFVSSEPPPAGDVDTDVAYPVTFYPSATDADVATRIMVAAGENATANVVITPVRAQHVTIPIDNNDQKRVGIVSAVQYIAEGITERADYMNSVGPEGITIEGLPPSRIDVIWTTGTGKSEEEHLRSLNLTGKIDRDSAATVVRGALDVELGMKAAGMTVKLVYANGGKPLSTTVGPDGRFEFREEMFRGRYSVEVPEMAEAAVGVRAIGAGVDSEGIEIQPGNDVELQISAGRGARIRGRVMKNGAAAEGIFVALVPGRFEDANNLMRVAQSDSDGTFRMNDVVPGRYSLIAVEDGWDADWRSAEFLGRFVGGGKMLEIGAGAVMNVEIEAAK